MKGVGAAKVGVRRLEVHGEAGQKSGTRELEDTTTSLRPERAHVLEGVKAGNEAKRRIEVLEGQQDERYAVFSLLFQYRRLSYGAKSSSTLLAFLLLHES